MKKLLFSIAAVICLIIALVMYIRERPAAPFSPDGLNLACSAKVNFDIEQQETLTHMEGRLSLNTLGPAHLSLLYTGRLITPEGRFILARTVRFHYRYHPANHTLELIYDNSAVGELDTAPDAVFYRYLVMSKTLILYLTRFSDRAWLISGLTYPLYVCNDR